MKKFLIGGAALVIVAAIVSREAAPWPRSVSFLLGERQRLLTFSHLSFSS